MFKKLLFATMLAIFVIGCSNKAEVKQTLENSNIIVENDEILDDFKLIGINKVVKSNGLTQIEADFKNTKNSDSIIAYRVDWKTSEGFTQESIMSRWVSVNVEAGRVFRIFAVSPSAEANWYEIRLSYPNDKDKLRVTPLNYENQGL